MASMTSSATSLFRSRARSSLRSFSVLAAAQTNASSSASSASSASPASSSSSPSSASWKPPVAPGTEPAYDEALRYISNQQSRLKRELPALEKEMEGCKAGTEERRIAEARLESHIVASQINDPEVQWKAANNVDVFAHLREQSWRKHRLPKLGERIRVMSVLPDAIYTLTPEVDLQVSFGQGEGFHDHGGDGGDVLPGCFVSAEKTVDKPIITATPFHADERLYTLAMIDIDAPNEKEDRMTTFAHWLIHDIPLSTTKTTIDVNASTEAMSYIPPHPQKGSKYHRYTLVLFQQSQPIDSAHTPTQRQGFSLHEYANVQSLRPAGIHFWRAEWKESSKDVISQIYADILELPEPDFVRTTK